MLSSPNPYVGAFMFTTGLYIILTHKFGLFTGKVCEVPNHKPVYLIEVFMTILGNLIGTFIFASLLLPTRIGGALSAAALDVVALKLSDSPLSTFIMSVLCGLLVCLAIYTYRACTEAGNHFGAALGVFTCIPLFILCGFNHCVADMYYLFLLPEAGIWTVGGMRLLGGMTSYLLLVILGNSVGCMLLPFLKKVKLLP